jgi:hypothetical protein
MTQYSWLVASWGLLLIIASPGWARTIMYDGKPIEVRLEYGQPTTVTFPEPIEVVPIGTDQGDLTVVVEDRTVTLQPRVKKLSGRLIVQTVTKRRYQLKFSVASPADAEIAVHLPAPPSGTQRLEIGEGQSVQSPVRALLVTMWTAGSRPPQAGVMVQPSQRVLAEDVVHRVRLVRIFQAPPYYGYTLEVENRTEHPWPLFLPQLEDDGLLISAAEPIVPPDQPQPPAEVIPSKGQALLHLIYQGAR